MLTAAEICEHLKTIPNGFKASDDDFFDPSNSTLFPKFKKLGVINDLDSSDNVENELRQAQPQGAVTEISCNVPGCKLIFDNVCAYQTHYNSLHRHFCSECKRSLPTAHLLDLHISERHDSYFAARVDRGDAMYACFVEECKQKFLIPKERKDHCVKAHKFPGNFRFDQATNKAMISTATKPTVKPPMSIKPNEDQMETNDEHEELLHKLKMFSFGHQREVAFPRRQSKSKEKGGKFPNNESIDL